MKCEAMAILFPGTFRLVGPDVDFAEIRDYLTKSFERLSVLQPEIVVFGSGSARNCPDGFCLDEAREQLIEVCRIVADAAATHNITIALEALNFTETNMINTILEANKVAKAVNCVNFRLTADIYHMLMNGESANDILQCQENLVHVHIASKVGRNCPKLSEQEMFAPFFQALREIEYDKRVSIEGNVENFEQDLPEAFRLFRELSV